MNEGRDIRCPLSLIVSCTLRLALGDQAKLLWSVVYTIWSSCLVSEWEEMDGYGYIYIFFVCILNYQKSMCEI